MLKTNPTVTRYNSESVGVDDAVPANAFDFRYDNEGCLISFWVPVNDQGSKELVHTERGAARLAAIESKAMYYDSRDNRRESSLVEGYSIDDYNTWK